jgi:cysteine desulfurase
MSRIFLDAQSTTPLHPEVLDAMRPFFSEQGSLPSAAYHSAKTSRKAIEIAREQVAECIGADSPEEILFTSSGTESNNLAVKGAALALKRFGNHLLGTTVDHPSVRLSMGFLESIGFEWQAVGVDSMGRLDGSEFLSRIQEKTMLACAPLCVPELGVTQSLCGLGKEFQAAGKAFFVDGTSWGGQSKLDVSSLKPALMSLSPHRFHGPKGVGVLYRRKGTMLEPLIHGGNQESGWRGGAEHVAGIVGAGKAFELLKQEGSERIRQSTRFQKWMWEQIQQRIPSVGLLGLLPGDGRICNQLNIVFEGVEGEGLMLMCNVRGLECHTGVSCVSKHVANDRIIEATGLPRECFASSLLLSWHALTKESDVQNGVEILAGCVERMRSMSPSWAGIRSGKIPSKLHLLNKGS